MRILREIDMEMRRFIAGRFPGRFPRLYSTMDAPNLKVPVQVAAYQLATRKYIKPGDKTLDVGFGLGYGLRIMAEKAKELRGIEIDRRAVSRIQGLIREVPNICEVKLYDGYNIPYGANTFDVVICIDVIEHVSDYMGLIMEMVRVSKRIIFMSTPNRRLEYTRPDGLPKNRWHLREWSCEEFNYILQKISNIRVDWNFLNGPWDGPFECTAAVSQNTLALTPALILLSCQGRRDDDVCKG